LQLREWAHLNATYGHNVLFCYLLSFLKHYLTHPNVGVGIGITNQRETTVAWDASTGKPLHNALVWHDTRTKAIVDQLIMQTPSQSKDHFAPLTGLPLSTYFSGAKMKWLLSNVAEVQKANQVGNLRFGTVDSWLIYCLTGGLHHGVHVTDFTNASRTHLLDLKSRTWSDTMLNFFGIDLRTLPQILPSSHVYGSIQQGPFQGIPIAGCLGDQQAALVGQKCFHPGDAKNTYGTGCFLLFNTGTQPVISNHGLLSTAGYDIPALGPPVYALEGSIAVGGAGIKWLRDNLGILSSTPEINKLAAEVEDTGDVYFVPAFSGLFAPYWRDDARGVLVGLTGYTNKHHLCRAVLESVGFQTMDVLQAMRVDAQTTLKTLQVDGGMTNSDLCMQLQADIAGIEVRRPAMRETTALGAALAAGLAVGALDVSNITRVNSNGLDVFKSRITQDERERRCHQWKKAVSKTLNWIDDENISSSGGKGETLLKQTNVCISHETNSAKSRQQATGL
jgi:glycerol kinase